MSSWRPFRSVACVVLLGLAALAATAEDPIPPVLVPHTDSYRFAAKPLGTSPANRFTRTVTGQFNDDPQLDVFVRRRGAQLYVNSSIWDAALAIPGIIRSLARLEGTSSTGRDELLVTTAAGLRAWTRDSAQGVFVSREIGDDELWGNAQLISADLDGLHGDDIVGVTVDGSHAMILLALGEGAFAPEIVFSLPEAPLGLVACDFGLTGSKSIAFLGTTSVYVTNNVGSPRYTVSAPGSAVATAIGDGVGESLVWIQRVGQEDVLRVFDHELVLTQTSLGNLDAVGIAAWDHDLDGDDDLAVTHRTSWDLRILTNQAGAFGAVAADVVVTGPPGAADTNSAWPAIGDLDGDGDDDVFVPVQADEMIFVLLNEAIDHDLRMPRLDEPVLFNHGSYGGTQVFGYLQASAQDAILVPPEATHVELALWRKYDLATPTDEEPAPGFSFRFELGTPYATGVLEYQDPGPSALFWILRYVRVVEDELVRVFPSRVYAVTTENRWQGGPVLDWLLDKGATVHSETFPDQNISGDPGFQHSRTTSTIVKLVPIVDYEENKEPGTGN